MNRRTLLQSLGLAGVASLIPFQGTKASQAAIAKLKKEMLLPDGGCVLVPTETAGPYPWPSDGMTLSTDTTFYRQNMAEDRTGLPLAITFTVVNINNNCAPVLNAAVVAWHCDKDGNYSEFGNSVGKTFLRGIQMTDANGNVTFKTIYPGWYSGRTTHIHFQVYLSSHLSATSQVAFPEAMTSQVYSSALYASRGQKDTSNASDMVFSNALSELVLTNISGDTTNGYTASFTIGIDAPTSGVINLEPETGGQFKLLQNYPNPVEASTTIPFTLMNAANVTLELFDINGKKVVEVINQRMAEGDQKVTVNKQVNGVPLSAGAYVYQLTVENANGSFRQCKVMTIE
jgi:protocatechuate 3,4-dioxygenase beta subunit